MYVEDLPSSLEIRQVDLDYSIKSTRSNECRVKQVLPVGCSHYNNVAISAKSIHFHQDLIESVISLVMGSVAAASFSPHCVDLINEDD